LVLSVIGASERAEKQIYRALRYHTLQDTQLHDTLRDLLSSLRAPAKGFKSAERILLARSGCLSFWNRCICMCSRVWEHFCAT